MTNVYWHRLKAKPLPIHPDIDRTRCWRCKEAKRANVYEVVMDGVLTIQCEGCTVGTICGKMEIGTMVTA